MQNNSKPTPAIAQQQPTVRASLQKFKYIPSNPDQQQQQPPQWLQAKPGPPQPQPPQATNAVTAQSSSSSSNNKAPPTTAPQTRSPPGTVTVNNDVSGGPKPAPAPAPNGQLALKCVLMETTNGDHSRFEVIGMGYHKTLIEIFKATKTYRYDEKTKRWNFSVRAHDDLVAQIRLRMGTQARIEPLEQASCGGGGKCTQLRFVLADRTRVEVHVSEFRAELKAVFDSVRSRRYDAGTRKYSFELRDYDELMRKIAEKFTHGEVSVVTLPKVRRPLYIGLEIVLPFFRSDNSQRIIMRYTT